MTGPTVGPVVGPHSGGVRPGQIRPLLRMVVAAAGRGRAVLVAATTSLVCGLLLVGVSIVRLGDTPGYGYGIGQEHLFQPIAEPGTRGGVIVAIILMQLPLLLLLDQAVRLGSTSRHRRYAALAVAGATRRDLRRWATVEVGAPAAVGAVLGVPVWWLLRQLLGHQLADKGIGALVPTAVGPGPWALAVIAAVCGYGTWAGRRSGSQMTALLAASRGVRRPPRPWGALVIVAVLFLFGKQLNGSLDSELPLFGDIVLLAVGVAGLAPWTAYRVAGVVARLARTVPTLLAARRLTADARPAGRAAAAIGAVALTIGVVAAFTRSILRGNWDPGEYLVPAYVAAACAVAATLVIATSLAVHSAETVLERRREMAALVANGVPASALVSSQRTECLIATVPLALAGTLFGGFGYGLADGLDAVMTGYILLATTAVALVVVGAVWVTTRMLRPWVMDAVSLEQLRTE
ncbi:hypothetical protein GCM10009844_06380 [Nocardioides koreensis]|uniref:FtsX-like permease family protein n=1 Tax=Nocardioides koreensis TaxID=433651 RepID=A0ABP5KWH4_9ACTN